MQLFIHVYQLKLIPPTGRLMKKLIFLNSLLLLLLGCKDESNMIKCKGIPDVNQTFSYMYFKTDNEGYLFGTYTEYGELSAQ